MQQLVYRYGISLDGAGYVHYVHVLEPLRIREQEEEILTFARANKVSTAGMKLILMDKLPPERFEEKYNAKNEHEE